MRQFTKKIHMVGIGGAGMCPLAELLLSRGHKVTGSDRSQSAATARLKSLGIQIQFDHTPNIVKDAEILIYSSAVREDNPERQYAREHGIVMIRRAEVLGDLMRDHFTICISGTHGKTTTTSLTGEVFQGGGLDPTVLIGGMLRGTDTHALIGNSNIMIAEADEFDRSFLAMYPSLAIITNIEADHLDCYQTLDNIKDAFVRFTARVPFYGAVIVCNDDPGVQDIINRIDRTVITYGVRSQADYTARDVRFEKGKSYFNVYKYDKMLGEISLNLPGIHNVSNSLAVIAAAIEMGIEFSCIARSLDRFQGVRRRFEIIGIESGITVVDDYAHHPGEISATIDAARKSGYKKVIAVFQPHLYSRTRDLMDEFVSSLSAADIVYVTDIYKAREEPIPGVSANTIVEKIIQNGHKQAYFLSDKEGLLTDIPQKVTEGDVVILMGAGDIWEYAPKLVKVLKDG